MAKYKSPNSTRINLRLPWAVVHALEAKAKAKGFSTVYDYIKASLYKATGYSEGAIGTSSINTSPRSENLTKCENPIGTNEIPIYDPLIHMPGDTVRIWNPKTKQYGVVIL